MTDGRSDNRNGIIWYLAVPRTVKLPGRDGIRDFTYKKALAPSRNYKTPKMLRVAWDIFFKGEFVVQRGTLPEVKAFIMEKLDT